MDLRLSTDELPIKEYTRFLVPIHPRLLTAKLDPSLPHRVFEDAIIAWHDRIIEESKTAGDQIAKVFLTPPKLTKEDNNWVYRSWKDTSFHNKTGLARVLALSRDIGGSFVLGDRPSYHSGLFKTTDAKSKAYSIDGKGFEFHLYEPNNCDIYPARLLLREWAVRYLNKCLESL